MGLVVILHCDVDTMISNNKGNPTYLRPLEKLFKKYKNTKIIWAHTGLGRYIKARPQHTQLLGRILSQYPNLFVDISWSVVVEQFLDGEQLRPHWKKFLSEHSKKILFGTDVVATSEAKYHKSLRLYDAVWQNLPQEAVKDITYGNYRQLFDEARLEVRLWEKEALKK